MPEIKRPAYRKNPNPGIYQFTKFVTDVLDTSLPAAFRLAPETPPATRIESAAIQMPGFKCPAGHLGRAFKYESLNHSCACREGCPKKSFARGVFPLAPRAQGAYTSAQAMTPRR